MTLSMNASVMTIVMLALAIGRPLGAQRHQAVAMTSDRAHDVSAEVVQSAERESCVGLRVKVATIYPVAFAAAGYVVYLFTLGFAKQTHIRQKFIWTGAAIGALYGTAHALFADCSDLPPGRRRRLPPPE